MITVSWWVLVMAGAAVMGLAGIRELVWERRLFVANKRRLDAEHMAAVWQEAHGVLQRRKRSAREYRPWGVQGGSA